LAAAHGSSGEHLSQISLTDLDIYFPQSTYGKKNLAKQIISRPKMSIHFFLVKRKKKSTKQV
jgi:hypothetical protein